MRIYKTNLASVKFNKKGGIARHLGHGRIPTICVITIIVPEQQLALQFLQSTSLSTAFGKPAAIAQNSSYKPRKQNCLYIMDRSSSVVFLIDIGTIVSIFPQIMHVGNWELSLGVANGSLMFTFGPKIAHVGLGVWRWLTWLSVPADAKVIIWGTDFLSYCGFLPDLKRRRLIDDSNLCWTPGKVKGLFVHFNSVLSPGQPLTLGPKRKLIRWSHIITNGF